MTDQPAKPTVPSADSATSLPVNELAVDDRLHSPGLEGVLAAETALGLVDGANGRLMYRGYRIGDLVAHGSYAAVAELLWTGTWDPAAHLPAAPVPPAVMATLRALPRSAKPMDALRTAVSVWGTTQTMDWPPSEAQARALTAFSPSALAAFARLRQDLEPIDPDPELDLVSGFLYQLKGKRPNAATARALDAYFIVAAEHGLNASTFTARIVASTGADSAAALSAAVGALSGPLHGGAPAYVKPMLEDVAASGDAERWVKDTLASGKRIMGFGHRIYRAEDPRSRLLKGVARELGAPNIDVAEELEQIALRALQERSPDRVLATNVEYYSAVVLDIAEIPPPLAPAMFACARVAGWSAHILEQKREGKLIRPSAKYVGPAPRSVSTFA